MTPVQAGAAGRRTVTALGTAFLGCPKTLRRARELGLTGWASYVAGRGGALGDVRADTAAAALGLIAPEAVRDGWASAQAVLPPSKVAVHMRAQCCRWGGERLAGTPRLERLVELAETVVTAADATGCVLFAAWRALPVPTEDWEARAAVALHLMHEHRAGVFVIALRSSGLTPPQALIAGPEGEAGAVAFGWQPPYPPAAQFARRRIWADAMADHLAGQAWQGLAARERAELVGLLNDTHAHARLT